MVAALKTSAFLSSAELLGPGTCAGPGDGRSAQDHSGSFLFKAFAAWNVCRAWGWSQCSRPLGLFPFQGFCRWEYVQGLGVGKKYVPLGS